MTDNMGAIPITTRLFKGGKKTGSKSPNSGELAITSPDGNRVIKTSSSDRLFSRAPKNPMTNK